MPGPGGVGPGPVERMADLVAPNWAGQLTSKADTKHIFTFEVHCGKNIALTKCNCCEGLNPHRYRNPRVETRAKKCTTVKTISTTHIHTDPHTFTLITHLNQRWATPMTLCGRSFGHSRGQSSRVKKTLEWSKLRREAQTLGSAALRAMTPSTPLDDYLTYFVHQSASSSMVTPNIAWEKQLKTLYYVCLAPLSKRAHAPGNLWHT